ncbi:hypothetical protein GIB67_000075 [Kingdonia uniflora]|uniref:Uncharacterized protein n=1 Tax=Kingdonia uniflora TaxID=39325 RepID=A0A7J7M7Q5_9MAGN|nr:hypothetical protein GIB67_000075 [Kingdonia uniflora]
MGCCSCFGFIRKTNRSLRPTSCSGNRLSQELLLDEHLEDVDGLYNGEATHSLHRCDGKLQSRARHSEEILLLKIQNGMICRDVPVRETHKVICSEDDDGTKWSMSMFESVKLGLEAMEKWQVRFIDRFVQKQKSRKAVFHKSHLLKSAMTDVLRELTHEVFYDSRVMDVVHAAL